jgi:hypothetical protein
VLDVPREEVTAVFGSGFVEGVLKESHVERGSTLDRAGKLHFAAKRQFTPALAGACIHSEVLALMAAGAIAFDVRGAEGQLRTGLEELVRPLRNVGAELNFVLPVSWSWHLRAASTETASLIIIKKVEIARKQCRVADR